MNRFFVVSEDIKDGQLKISDSQQLHHIKNVLHIKIGENIEACDENEFEYIARLEQIKADALIFKIVKIKELKESSLVKITIACAIPKNVKMDDIVDKLTQLGVSRIIPLETERVIVKIDAENAQNKLSRWRKIAQSASEQSRSNIIPVIDEVKSLGEVLKEADKFDLKIMPTLEGNIKKLSLRGAIATKQSQKSDCFAHAGCAMTSKVIVLIGPEGDFTSCEVALAKKAGFLPISLGPTVLRVDTAAIAVVSFIRLYENS